ncbi:hypothetical protein KXD93_25490 [Mucilaginibacter sp. BJC16-A38]|uniref:hypothetical protein n=1 Tax=Mucilaginibacter phenanthrenivorans TaxID=1234842 RepID=UPI002157AECC|nr:hypothetical protein [Mucilaginibacter phenanthrenivorans]MCR8561036.1 hypothetical protein [Mucilaginibacter phenanthrenivorans]
METNRIIINIDRITLIVNHLFPCDNKGEDFVEKTPFLEKHGFLEQWHGIEYPDPETLPVQYDPKKDGN